MSIFFSWASLGEHFLRWASWVEHFFLDEQIRESTFNFWGEHLSLLCLPPPQWRQVLISLRARWLSAFFQKSNKEEHFFQMSKLRRALFLRQARWDEHSFQKSTRDKHCIFRSVTQLSTFFQMRKVDEHLLSITACRSSSYQMNKVVEQKITRK